MAFSRTVRPLIGSKFESCVFSLGSGGSLYTYIVNGSMILNGVGIVFGKGSLRLGSRILARCKNNMVK